MARIVEKIAVRFIMKNAPYNVGEIAGFPEAIAKRLVDRKRAVYYEPEGEKATSESAGGDDEPETSESVVPVHIGGPMYMVGDQKVKGKNKAEALADELNAAAKG